MPRRYVRLDRDMQKGDWLVVGGDVVTFEKEDGLWLLANRSITLNNLETVEYRLYPISQELHLHPGEWLQIGPLEPNRDRARPFTFPMEVMSEDNMLREWSEISRNNVVEVE